jgi:hypothetical protein
VNPDENNNSDPQVAPLHPWSHSREDHMALEVSHDETEMYITMEVVALVPADQQADDHAETAAMMLAIASLYLRAGLPQKPRVECITTQQPVRRNGHGPLLQLHLSLLRTSVIRRCRASSMGL